MIKLSEDSRLRLANQNVWSRLGEDVVILDLSSSSYLGLAGVGATLWNMLAEPRSVSELETDLAALYEVDARVLSKDVRPFLEDLVARGLLVLDDEDARSVP